MLRESKERGHDIQDYHTGPADVADISTQANANALLLHHFAPPPDIRIIKNLYKKELKTFDGSIHFVNDGDKFIVE